MFSKITLSLLIALASATSFAAATPPDRFLKVDDNVYRGAVIDSNDKMLYLKSLGVKSIVSMITDKKLAAQEQAWGKANGINVVWVPVDGIWGPNDAQTKVIQQWLNAKHIGPTYIHCTHGRDRTGVEVGLYRVWTNGWTAHKAYNEMKELGFRKILIPMTKYYKDRSGFEDEEDAGIEE